MRRFAIAGLLAIVSTTACAPSHDVVAAESGEGSSSQPSSAGPTDDAGDAVSEGESATGSTQASTADDDPSGDDPSGDDPTGVDPTAESSGSVTSDSPTTGAVETGTGTGSDDATTEVGTSGPVEGACAPDDADDACTMCTKDDCCTELSECLDDPACECAWNCVEAGGTAAACANDCGAVEGGGISPTFQALLMCQVMMCALC